MTVKPTVSLTDQGYDLAKSLVENGKFASVSAVMQYGLRLVEREEESHRAHLDAIRIDLERRVQEPTLSGEEMDCKLDELMSRKRQAWFGNEGA